MQDHCLSSGGLQFRAEFLNYCIISILCWMIPCYGLWGCFVHCRKFSIIHVFCVLVAFLLNVTTKNVFRYHQMSFGGMSSSQLHCQGVGHLTYLPTFLYDEYNCPLNVGFCSYMRMGSAEKQNLGNLLQNFQN